MHPGHCIVIGLVVLCLGTVSCNPHTKPAPSPVHATFLAWAQERGYADLKPWPRRGSDGLCWVDCQSSATEAWYKLGACPGEWFSIIHFVRDHNTWRAEETSWEDASPEAISACRYG